MRKKKPIHLAVGQKSDHAPTTRTDITQQVIVFNQDTWDKRDAAKKEVLYAHLREVLANEEHKVLVFVSSKTLANELRDTLWHEGFKTDSMHGGRTQDQRLAVLHEFKHGETKLLVCTDVMGRGLDIPDISHVVIYDMGDTEDYVHRIGRTARGPTGEGHALTLFEFDKKWPMIAVGLVKILEECQQPVPPELREIAEEVAEMGDGMPESRHSYTGGDEDEELDYTNAAKKAAPIVKVTTNGNAAWAKKAKTALVQTKAKQAKAPVAKAKAKAKKAVDPDDICWDFAKGRCKKGASCKYVHDASAVDSDEEEDASGWAGAAQQMAMLAMMGGMGGFGMW